VKVVQGKSYGFNAVTAIGSNGANVWVANSAQFRDRARRQYRRKLNVFKKAQFGFDGPARLSDDGRTSGWQTTPATRSPNSNATTGALVRVIKGFDPTSCAARVKSRRTASTCGSRIYAGRPWLR